MSTRHALVIGCEADDLPGVQPTLSLMKETLVALEFGDVVSIGLVAAPRDPALTVGGSAPLTDALTALRSRVSPGDVALLYYVGHTTILRTEHPDGGHTCSDAIARDRLGGLLGAELERHIDELCEQTDNVVVVLDCCDAADIVFLRVHATSPRRPSLCDRFQYASGDASHREQWPRVVVISASSSGGTAFIHPTDPAERMLFTVLLCEELSRKDRAPMLPVQDLTWQELALLVGDRVREHRSGQCVGVSGARFRRLFSTESEFPEADEEPARVDGTQAKLLYSGALREVRCDDVFELVIRERGSPDVRVLGVGRVIATEPEITLAIRESIAASARVVHVRPVHADEMTIAVDPAVAGVLGLRADQLIPGMRLDPRAPVKLHWNAERGAVEVREADCHVVAVVPVDGGDLLQSRFDVVLSRMERWRRIQRTIRGQRRPEFTHNFAVHWGLLADGAEIRLEINEVVAAEALPMFLRVHKHDPRSQIFAMAYRVRADRAIVPVLDAEWAVQVEFKENRYLGALLVGHRQGIQLDWPSASLPSDVSHASEWLLLVVSDHGFHVTELPCDTHYVEGVGVRGKQRYHIIPIPYRLRPAPLGMCE